MRAVARFLALAFLVGIVPSASAKEFTAVVAVGAGGASAELRAPEHVIGHLLDPRAGRAVRGQSYVRLYQLSHGGFPGIPGRFYPDNDALCFAWPDAQRNRGPCHRADRVARRFLAPVRRLPPLVGAPTTLVRVKTFRGKRLEDNVAVALDLAFGRYRLARRSLRPHTCVRLLGDWRGPAARARPRRFCLSPRGVYVRSRLYPVGVGVWQFVATNL